MTRKPLRAMRKVSPEAAHESYWRDLGLSAAASRSLVEARLNRVSDLRKISLLELTALPDISKSALARIKLIMTAKKIEFRL